MYVEQPTTTIGLNEYCNFQNSIKHQDPAYKAIVQVVRKYTSTGA